MLNKKYIYVGCVAAMVILGHTFFAQRAPEQSAAAASQPIIVFTAKKIVTMNPDMPEATAVAVREGKILAVGSLDSMQPWLKRYKHTIDDRFKNEVLVPGFIEAHMHPHITTLLWEAIYLGYFDRVDPTGNPVKVNKNKQEVLNRIKQVAEEKKARGDTDGWIFGWGYQPEFYDDSPLTVEDTDPITRPYDLLVENSSMHIYYVNSSVLKKMKLKPEDKVAGVMVKDGKFTGEIAEVKAIERLLPYLPKVGLDVMKKVTRDVGVYAHRVGVTTINEAALGFLRDAYEAYKAVVPEEDFPVRLVIFPEINFVKSQGGISYLQKMYAQNSDKLSFGAVKFITDGSLPGYTANLLWTYYINGKNGVENMTLEEIKKDLLLIHKAGYQAAIHTNADQATENALQAVEYVLDQAPRVDHRHRFEHNQMVNDSQLRRMKAYGLTTNLFVNHVHYWGDLYAERFLGYDRTKRLNPAKSALDIGVPFSFHSDASVTTLDPLKTIWIAATRKTLSGKVMGPEQRISVYEALKAVTLGAAYLLFQDDVKGSIEVGKFADFAVLDKNPLTVPVDDIPKIKVKATIMGGRVFPVRK